jgi:ABC-type uncharacterized transport system permease subunit
MKEIMTRRERLASMMLVLAGGVFTLNGLSHLSLPQAMLALHGLELTTISAYSDVRAGYGGLYVSLGLVFLGGVVSGQVRELALLMLAAVTGGLAAGRLLSLAVDGAPSWTAWVLLAIELLAALSVAAVAVHWQQPRRARRR